LRAAFASALPAASALSPRAAAALARAAGLDAEGQPGPLLRIRAALLQHLCCTALRLPRAATVAVGLALAHAADESVAAVRCARVHACVRARAYF